MQQSFQYQASKAKFIRRMILIVNICMTIFSFVAAIYKPNLIYLFIVGLIASITCHILLLRVGERYHKVVNLYYLVIFCVITFSIFFTHENTNVIRGIWLTIFTFFAFMTLGNTWGWVYMTATMIIFTIYFNFFFPTTEEFANILLHNIQLIDVFEFVISMVFLVYIMRKIEKINDIGVAQYNETISQLEEENSIVSEQNEEKGILLNEIHSRVKNNLQLVISLLRIQLEDIKEEDTKVSFKNAIQRISTMSLIHQKVYQSSDSKEISVQKYITDLVQNIIHSHTEKDVKANLDITVNTLNSSQIAPLGLIINELVTNTLKHAFRDKDSGEIKIQILEKNDNSFKLYYADNGKWKEKEGISLGSDLIDIFSNQLDGIYERDIKEEGTTYIFEFRKN